MKIVLIAPNHKNIVSPTHMQAVQEGLGHLPPLGLLCIASYIEAQGGHSVKVLDALLQDWSNDEIAEFLLKESPDVIGIHTITFALLDVLETAKLARKILPNAKIVLGGPHTLIFPKESLGFSHIDYIVMGEGEVPFFNLIQHLNSPASLKKDEPLLKGVVSRETLKDSSPEPYYHKDPDTLPFPRRDYTPYEKYSSVVSLHPPSTTLMGSRGCPFSCTFCFTAGGKIYRQRSVESLMDEIKHCESLGINEFLFFDETFTLKRDRVLELCSAIEKEKLKIYWDVRARVDLVDKEMLQRMKKTGCQRIQFGVESGSKKILERLKKGFTPQQARNALKITKEAGIATYADFMIGNPDETLQDIYETLNFALELNPDYVHYSITMPLPRTQLYKEALDRGIIEKDYWTEFAKSPSKDFKIRYWEENFTAAQLEELLTKAYHSFYLRPSYMLKSLTKIKSAGELFRKFNAGINLLKIKKQ